MFYKRGFIMRGDFTAFKAATHINAHINNDRPFFHVFHHSFGNQNRGAVFPSYGANDHITSFKCFNKVLWLNGGSMQRSAKIGLHRTNLVRELSKILILAPRPRAERAANSPTVPAPRMTTSIGGTPLIFPNINPFPAGLLLMISEAINMEAVPAISLSARNCRVGAVIIFNEFKGQGSNSFGSKLLKVGFLLGFKL